jgi:drug/metabolite transporter (DMT)-like permease
MKSGTFYPTLQALLAAILFGASAPLAKLLLGEIEPVLLAALLYLGSGFGLLAAQVFRKVGKPAGEAEAGLKKADLPWLTGAILCGGIAAPIVLMFSLRETPAATASILLNFEGVATTLIALIFFKEAIGRRAVGAIALITLASIFLTLNLKGGWGFSLGALGVLAACILWGMDINFTRNISAKDPLTIVTIKGLAAGTFSLILALMLGNRIPRLEILVEALVLGSLSYGLSIVLFVWAMRGLGAARTSAWFGTAPLVGVILSFVFFREAPGILFLIALPLMIVGAFLLLNEDHSHRHVHEPVSHEHRHHHDDGHHEHEHEIPALAAHHSHVHSHARQEHDHHHLPDTDHRHIHPGEA